MNYEEINLKEIEQFYCPFDTCHQYATLEKGIYFLSSGVISRAYLDYEEAKKVGESMQIPDYDSNVLCIKKEEESYSVSTMWYSTSEVSIDKKTMEDYINKMTVVGSKSQVKKRIL